MGFQDFGDFGHPRHPAIRATGLLTFALAGLTPAEHTNLTGSQLPDGRLSRVRLATTTIGPTNRTQDSHSFPPRNPRMTRKWLVSVHLLAALVGISIWKVEPLPKADSTQMRPPCISTICLAMASPSPVPPLAFVRELSTWVN